MMIKHLSEDLCKYLKSLPQVKECRLSGSLVSGNFDRYSDIDVEIDVSGTDNSQFAINIPHLLSSKFPIIYYDYASGLAPEKLPARRGVLWWHTANVYKAF